MCIDLLLSNHWRFACVVQFLLLQVGQVPATYSFDRTRTLRALQQKRSNASLPYRSILYHMDFVGLQRCYPHHMLPLACSDHPYGLLPFPVRHSNRHGVPLVCVVLRILCPESDDDPVSLVSTPTVFICLLRIQVVPLLLQTDVQVAMYHLHEVALADARSCYSRPQVTYPRPRF